MTPSDFSLPTSIAAAEAAAIPVAAPDLRGREAEYALRAIESSWISSTGEYVDRFETEFAELCGTAHALSVCNGTAALHLALLALDIGPGDEVIVPSLTYIATANAVTYVGATPVFADVDPQTWCLDPRDVQRVLSPRTRAIIAVHLYGHPADMDAICEIADGAGIPVVEDAAEAHLARYRSRPVGSLARCATFSFYGNKTFTSGEGGAITTDDPALADRLRLLRGQGMDPEQRYFFPIVGYNYRLTNVACAILCAQLERREAILGARRRIFASYSEALADVPGIAPQSVASWAEPTPWLYGITVDERRYGQSRDDLAVALAEARIETRPFFIPLHTLPPYRQLATAQECQLPVTERIAAEGLSLPTSSMMTPTDVERVCAAIRRDCR